MESQADKSVLLDALVLGAGAAGLMTAAVAGQGGARVAVLDHADEPGRKILISGGGRCNFTHLEAQSDRYISANPRFARSALSACTPQDFLGLVERHHIAWHEKDAGQLFCDGSARQIVEMLLAECTRGQVKLALGQQIEDVSHDGHCFHVRTNRGLWQSRTLVLATGGLAIPKLGATGLSLQLARQFGLKTTDVAPGLVPLTLSPSLAELAGVSLPVTASLAGGAGKAGRQAPRFTDGLVFTHRGLSGPAILQISSYRQGPQPVCLNLLPHEKDVLGSLLALRQARPKAQGTALLPGLPVRLARMLVAETMDERPVGAQSLATMRRLAERLTRWELTPSGTEGYAKAEVMRGGIDTHGLEQKTMEAKTVPGLFAVGEAVDVTGWLGGYNFQWAWASGTAAGRALAARAG
ncbi:BaiN/RdsA family NAD(P)/FAD-dependent oxidoreductase [Oecophyllibacter saccharovorans]|uniref:Aminoacetone oxidase family FAD-binding enzyme n=1 Tax=Oecophyllibacter saccharovorans TaxID=2558360 RepID=A0A506US93_9PROT|nr:aminoacetone oxidase family FAD-binding enzyme [Oecophyllibacter saccharovorans]TPW35963.1 aminoacetone oxidase family FAD-binding enzyme [Oecophyllibacter saccharovorans]